MKYEAQMISQNILRPGKRFRAKVQRSKVKTTFFLCAFAPLRENIPFET
jgi:hypothetical protein